MVVVTIIYLAYDVDQVLLTTHWNHDLGIPDTAFVLTDTVVLTIIYLLLFLRLIIDKNFDYVI